MSRSEGVPDTDGSGVVDNPTQSRFERAVADSIAARIVLVHREVPQHLSGQGDRLQAGPWCVRGDPRDRAQDDRQMPAHGSLLAARLSGEIEDERQVL